MREQIRKTIRAYAPWLALTFVLHAQQYQFHAYRQAEGLGNVAVTSIAAGPDGLIWVATENGLYRFLGSGFERFGPERGIVSQNVRDVVISPGGTVWAATDENLYRLQGQRFVPARSEPTPVSGSRRIGFEDAGNLLVIFKRQVYRLRLDSFGKAISFAPVFSAQASGANSGLQQVFSLTAVHQPSGALWLWAGCGSSLCAWPGGVAHSTSAPVVWDQSKGLPADRWQQVLLDRSGTLWAVSLHHIAVLAAGASRFALRDIPGSDPQSIDGHAPLVEDAEGRILVSSDEGIARWEGQAWRVAGRSSGLESTYHTVGMVFDQAGDLWFGVRGDGLYHWTGYAAWEGWTLAQGLPAPAVWSVAPAGRTTYIATEKGPAALDLATGTVRGLGPGWKFGSLSVIDLNRDGSVFAATLPGGIFRIDPATGVARKLGNLSGYVIQAFRGAAGVWFFSTDRGIETYSSEAGRGRPVHMAAADPLLGETPRVDAGCESSPGNVWFLSGNRFLHFSGGVWSRPAISGLDASGGALTALACAPDGALWVVGDRGAVWRLAAERGALKAARLSLPPELRMMACLAVQVDRRGWIWIGSDAGLVVWNGSAWRHLTQESGLVWNDVNQGALRFGPDGSLWIGTSGGLARLMHPETVFSGSLLPPSLVSIRRGDQPLEAATGMTLPWATTPLAFQLASPDLRNRSEQQFQYRLAGLQTDWIASRDGFAAFPALPPGRFVFEARVVNAGLSQTSDVVRVPLRILDPWWRTGWSYALCCAAVVLALFGFFRIRHHALVENERRLRAMVRERTRELEASREQLRVQATRDGLTSLLNRTEALRLLEVEMERARRESRTLVVALADLDHFKQVNDTYGHLAGDEVLRRFARALETAVRPYDFVGRYGGEEFLIVLTLVPRTDIRKRLTVLHQNISGLEVAAFGQMVPCTCSLGAAAFHPGENRHSIEALIAAADRALYEAKDAGRNRVVVAGPELPARCSEAEKLAAQTHA